ncbi:MAG: hypothetical protein ABH858_06030 [Candidatus Omnitrophota bacterium]
MEKIAIGVFTAIVISFISSWITVHLSLRRFRTEKWWEKKVDAYSKVIEALHNAKAFSTANMSAEENAGKISNSDQTSLRARTCEANEEIFKAMDVGGFLLSKDALSSLKQYRKDATAAEHEQSWYGHLEQDWAATEKCLKDIIEIAKKDLKITP